MLEKSMDAMKTNEECTTNINAQKDIAKYKDLPKVVKPNQGLGSDTNWNHLEGGWIGDGYMKYDNNAELKNLLNKLLKLKD